MTDNPVFLFAGMAAEAVEKTHDYTWVFVGLAAVITALGIAIPLVINAITKLRTEVAAASVAAAEKAEAVVEKVEKTVEKVGELHDKTGENQNAIEKELARANRHIEDLRMLAAVGLKNRGVIDATPENSVEVQVMGTADDGIVVIGGTRYTIVKVEDPKE